MRFYEASEGSTLVRSAGTRPGRRTRGTGRRVPTGTGHAVAVGDSMTLCGLDLRGLVTFASLDFEVEVDERRCPACQAAIAEN